MSKIYASLLITVFISISAQTQQLAPSIVWQKSFGGSGTDQANAIIKAFDGGFLVVGSSKSNDGDVSGHHGSTDSTDAWVVKLSAEGNLEWQRSFGGSGNDVFNNIIPTADGNYICIGSTLSNNNGDVTGYHAEYDIWVVKMDRYGNLLWQKSFGGSMRDLPGNIRQKADGTFYLIGTTASNDGNVSGNHGGLSIYRTDIWVVNFDNSGNVNWQRCFGGTSDDEGFDIIESDRNGFIMATTVSSDDGDFGVGGGNTPRGYIIKVDSSHVMKWKMLSQRTWPSQLTRGENDRVYVNYDVVGCYPLNPNFGAGQTVFTDNPNIVGTPSQSSIASFQYCNFPITLNGYKTKGASGLAIVNSTDNILACSSNDSLTGGNVGFHGGVYDGFISGIKTSGSVAWKKFIGGTGIDELLSVTPLNEYEFLVAGKSNSNNGDVSGNHGDYDFWVVKLGKVNKIKGTAYTDYNLNGIKDANEPFVNNIVFESRKNSLASATPTSGGIFSNLIDTGTFITKPLTNIPYYTSSPLSFSNSFLSYYNTDSISFALQPLPGKRDYRIDLFTTTPVRPGFDVTYKIQCFNIGTDTLSNKTVKLIKDSRLQFLSAVPAQVGINGDTITWNIATLSPRDTTFIDIQLKAAIPPVLNILDQLSSVAIVDSTGDLNPVNNKDVLRSIASGSFDPNDKQESGAGSFYKEDYDSGKYLDYTIRFQNTGTDTAFNIVVRDTLSTKLDSNSIEMISASHPYQLTIKDGKYFTWTFTNILLPDSNRNEGRSHGYITYRIKPKTGLSVGDTIINSASIYFDFNPPVKTNIQETIIKPTPVALPPQPLVSGLLGSYCSTQGIQKGKIDNLPAAGSGITVAVKLDTVSLTVAADSTFSFDVSSLAAGPHSIVVVYTNSDGSRTTTINFTSSVAVTPNVNVSANITTIINADPIIVTATNVTGGGASPLYTFSRDRTFNTVIQAEGTSDTAPIDPATLVEGANWIYVRMKTSATCYTVQTNIDSIKLTVVLPPAQPTLSGLLAEYCNTDGTQFGKITNLPATGGVTSVEVKLDASLLTVAADSTFSFPAYALSTGAHAINVKFINAAGSKTTTHNFTVSAAVMPDVNVSANITNIINLAVPVVVTATSASGGGSSPLYTFGKDRNFSAVWQAEGTSNTLNLTPSALTVGDNWVYVQMKSNANCLTMQVATDSIKLVRDMSTGITDPDNPGKIISLYPNPFNKQVFIKGLSAAKTYTITITNLTGQLIQQSRISNRTNAELLLQTNKAGTYLLSIYDEGKKLLLGTAKLIKR